MKTLTVILESFIINNRINGIFNIGLQMESQNQILR